jgi:anti-sigma factor RsiW
MTVSDPATLTCQELVELLTDLLGDELEAEDRARLEQHLLVCPPCTLHLAQLKTSIALTAELKEPAEAAPVLELFRKWKVRA